MREGVAELADRVRAAWTDVLDTDAVMTDSFVAAGGHSLAAARLVARLRGELGVEIPLAALLRDDPTLSQFAELVAGQATAESPAAVVRVPDGPVQSRPAELPLAPTMRRIWAWHRLYPESPAYNVSRVLRVEGRLRSAALRAAAADLAVRHEALRCAVPEPRPGEPRIRVGEPAPVPVSVQVAAGTPADPMAGVDQALHQIGARPFPLDTAPLWRLGVVFVPALKCSFVVLVIHHLISDLRSSDQVLHELALCYEARLAGRMHSFADAAPSLLEHVEHELGLVGTPAWDRDLDWWAGQLGAVGTAAVAPLPFAAADCDERVFAARTHTVDLTAATSAAVNAALRASGATPATFFLTAAAAVVQAWAGGSAETVGVPSVRLHRPEDDRLVGFLLDTLPLRIVADRAATFADACARTREAYTDAADHALPAFDDVVDRLRLPRATGARSPLIRLWFSDMTRADMPTRFGDLVSREYDLPPAWSLFELGIYLRTDDQGRYRLHLVVPRGRYSPADTAQLPAQIARLAVRAAADPSRTLGELLAPDAEPTAAASLGAPKSVPQRVAAHALARPTAIALADGDGVLDYRTLNELVARDATRLPSGAVVALPARRDRMFVVRLLACRLAGVTAVLVDAAWPRARRERAAVVAGATHAYPETGAGPALPTGHGTPQNGPGHVLCTSGTTGDPLSVRVSAAASDAALADLIALLAVTPADRVAMLSGAAHDPVLRDIGLALHVGATLCLPPPGDLRGIASWLRRERVGVVNATPALLGLALATEDKPLPDVRVVVCGGSVLSSRTAALIRLRAPHAVVVNGYGCTETPQLVAAHLLPPLRPARTVTASGPSDDGEWPDPGQQDADVPAAAHVPIGRPLPGRRIELRAADGRLCDVGQAGELWVAGPHLADGYLGTDVPPRFTTDATGTRWLRTGDLARRDAAGLIHLAGRTDRQVLLGGHRVTLDEIEGAARGCPGIVDALAQVVGDADDRGARIWAQHAPGRPVEPATVRAHLEAVLPAGVVPARVLVVDQLDLGVNLKPAAPAVVPTQAASPGTDLDTDLKRLAESMLGRSLDPGANFFDAGFTSVSLVQLAAELGELVGRPVAPLTVFQHPNLSALGMFLQGPRPLAAGPRTAAGEGRARSRELRRAIRASLRESAP